MKVATLPQLAVTVLTLAVTGFGQAPPDRGLASIVDSGSTNTNGLRIVVEPSGKMRSTASLHGSQPAEPPATKVGTVPATLARRLYSDLDAAWPLASLPPQHCLKSASFGTKLTIEFGGQTTPDLSCGHTTDPRLRALARDAHEIVAASEVKTSRN